MAFSVSTSWLLPMNDRLHVRMGVDLSEVGEQEATIAEVGRYLGTLPEYSIVEMTICAMYEYRIVMTGSVVYGPGATYASAPVFDNFFAYDVHPDDVYPVKDVGFCIPARDVRHAVVRVVPDMAAITTPEDLAHYQEELSRAMEEALSMAEGLAEAMPDGSLMDLVAPYPDQGTGVLVDDSGTAVIYKGQLCPLPADSDPSDPGPSGPIQNQ